MCIFGSEGTEGSFSINPRPPISASKKASEKASPESPLKPKGSESAGAGPAAGPGSSPLSLACRGLPGVENRKGGGGGGGDLGIVRYG